MNRTVVVTGSASGIGKATAELLKANGNRVIGVDLRDAEIEADLSTADGCARMSDAAIAAADGTIDAVVANAGVFGAARLCYALNYHGMIRTLEGLRPALARSSAPRVAVTSSMSAGMFPSTTAAEALERGEEPDLDEEGAGYAVSKLAIARWIRRSAGAPDWGRSGILVNGLCPGIIETPMGVASLDNPQAAALIPVTPLARLGKPEEMAAIFAFLVSEENSYMAGQIIFADGGLNATMRPDLV